MIKAFIIKKRKWKKNLKKMNDKNEKTKSSI